MIEMDNVLFVVTFTDGGATYVAGVYHSMHEAESAMDDLEQQRFEGMMQIGEIQDGDDAAAYREFYDLGIFEREILTENDIEMLDRGRAVKISW